MSQLLTRDEFRNGVFKRDGGLCVLCKLIPSAMNPRGQVETPAADAHHVMERRLWPDGGYYLDNGASVCPECHLRCETTEVSTAEVRAAAGIAKIILPPHLYKDQTYDKWGNPVLPNGQRLKGELFDDESVQKILAGHLQLFTDKVKYPRTHHLPWSGNITDDDRVMEDLSGFEGEEVVVTEKMDGENTTLYKDHYHARSMDSGSHPSRSWVANLWGSIAHDIPEGWRICGENLFATHSIHYDDLPSYFMVYSIWSQRNVCLPWDDTVEWATLFGLQTVPVLWRGQWDKHLVHDLHGRLNPQTQEGYVVRVTKAFPAADFRKVLGKYVRKGHVMTTKHWMHGQPIVPNGLRKT